jgi:glyoxylase-like metal-dependent hydrolase (beta-lactamase superfamily II)
MKYEEIFPGLYRIEGRAPCEWVVPTSSYLIIGEEAFLIDPGYKTESLPLVLKELLPAGMGLHILLTHGHIDHYESFSLLKRAFQAKIYVHPKDIKKVSIGGALKEVLLKKEEVQSHWRSLGFMDLEVVWKELGTIQALYVDPIEEVLPLPSSWKISQSEELRVIHTPGHTSGSVSFWWPNRSLLFSGDILLPWDQETWLSGPCFGEKGAFLEDYERSLKKIANLSPKLILPGHGEPFSKVKKRILEIHRKKNQRKKEILEALDRDEKLTAYSLSLRLGDKPKGYPRIFHVGMIFELLKELERENLLSSETEDGVILWRRV